MGIMDKFTNIFGSKKSTATEAVKGPSQVLRENGIDPSKLKFSFKSNGAIAVSGEAASQSECDQICKTIESMPNVNSVQNNIVIAAPAPEPVPEVAAEPEVTAEETKAEAEAATPVENAEGGERTYTVESGDTLWAIAQKMYGSGGKYMKIFEANTSILDNPDKIRPGQKLVIPDLEKK